MLSSKKTGQSPIEIIGVAIIVVGLLLLVLITTYSRNQDTIRLLSRSGSSLQCNEMASVITRLHSNRATTKETISLAKDATVDRIAAKPGSIKVGAVSCEYIGNVTSDGVNDMDAGNLSIAKGTWCFEKMDENILINEGECT